MLYSEFLKGTRAPETPDTYDQFQIIGQIYEDCEGMTKEEAYRIWKQTYGRELKRRELRQRERLELLINREDYDSADRPHRAAIYHELSTLFWAAYYNKDGSRCRLATEGRCFTDVYGITWILRYDGRYPNGNTIFKLYITTLLNNTFEEFQKANDGLDLDFVYMGSWLTVDKKGDFVDKDDDSIKYKDHIDVIIGKGEKRWSLWGLQNSPEDGQLIVACREKEDAVQQLTAWLQENPEAAERYSVEDLELRYMASVVPVDALSEADGIPKIYIMSFAPTATIAYGKYAMNVFRGAYKKIGIPARTGLTSVVTRLSTEEQRSRTDASVSWLAIKFEAMGVFNPEDYTTK